MMNIKRRYFALAGAAAAAIGLSLGAAGAAGATTGQLTLPVAYPQGVAMDALNWGGTGTSASCAAGNAVSNAYIGVWKSTGAGCASLFKPVAIDVNGNGIDPKDPAQPFELVYSPNGSPATNGGTVPNGFCVSTYANSSGTFARLRPCQAVLNLSGGVYTATEGSVAVPVKVPNQWQTFRTQQGTVDDPGAVQIETLATDGPGALCLNDKAFGGNGAHVISYSCTPYRANEAWNVPSFG